MPLRELRGSENNIGGQEMQINYITGYAGTGKSTQLLRLLPELPKSSILLAPTHKALARLAKEVTTDIELKTIHSILGWIPTINEDAEDINHIETTAKLNRPLEAYTNIVIDEAGMMSEDMLTEITAKLEEQNDFETDHITIHLFLDPYQLLPVKGRQIQIDEEFTTNLTTQHRAESPDVVALFTKFVNFLEGINDGDLQTPYSDNVRHFDLTKFKHGDRLLAFTNQAVGDYNTQLARLLGITSWDNQSVQLGSRLQDDICEGLIDPTPAELMRAYEEGDLLLQNSQINRKYLSNALTDLVINPDIDFIMSGGNIVPVIIGIGNANKVKYKAKEAAIANRSKYSAVYALGRAFVMDYTFATTVHKAQGSEFDTVFIDKLDIQKSIFGGNYNNYARLMYVAISRAKKIVYL